ncbi:YolD-like family protein [Cohnella cholangitidis]|uniref:YolD-like family protein n=1 Tax=Cohnella cholangitidis TaxID=2598458 RepID=A0A7G5BTD8_9BACL|nr:YolD-like family protein [Cohnella cholangitidis]QMV40222.1 YolD-like family protein [Cohnella cholangitidis]
MPPVEKPKKKAKDKRPTRDEAILEEIGERLVEALVEESEVVLTVWGVDEVVQGLIVALDARTKLVHVQRAGATTKVPFMDIMKVESPD